eukprot:gene3722-13788_t
MSSHALVESILRQQLVMEEALATAIGTVNKLATSVGQHRGWMTNEDFGAEAEAGSERLPYHRFCAPLKSHDYMLADDDIDFVVQPPLPTIEGESMVGVSFFAPIDLLGTAAHAYYQRRAPDSECYNVDRNKFLPDGVDFHQDTMEQQHIAQ